MGTFSSFTLDKPILCPVCGEQHFEIQTANNAHIYCGHFQLGDYTPICNGIIEANLTCFNPLHDGI